MTLLLVYIVQTMFKYIFVHIIHFSLPTLSNEVFCSNRLTSLNKTTGSTCSMSGELLSVSLKSSSLYAPDKGVLFACSLFLSFSIFSVKKFT